MRTLQKWIARMSLAVLWMMGSAVLVLLSLFGLWVLKPLNDAPPQPKFFLSLFLYLVFEMSVVAFIISINCWGNLKLTCRRLNGYESLAERSNQMLFRTGQEMLGNEQYA